MWSYQRQRKSIKEWQYSATSTLNAPMFGVFTQLNGWKGKKGQKTTPFGVIFMRSQVVYQAAQMLTDCIYLHNALALHQLLWLHHPHWSTNQGASCVRFWSLWVQTITKHMPPMHSWVYTNSHQCTLTPKNASSCYTSLHGCDMVSIWPTGNKGDRDVIAHCVWTLSDQEIENCDDNHRLHIYNSTETQLTNAIRRLNRTYYVDDLL